MLPYLHSRFIYPQGIHSTYSYGTKMVQALSITIWSLSEGAEENVKLYLLKVDHASGTVLIEISSNPQTNHTRKVLLYQLTEEKTDSERLHRLPKTQLARNSCRSLLSFYIMTLILNIFLLYQLKKVNNTLVIVITKAY